MKKFFTRGDKVVIWVFVILCFPVALWIWIRPRHYHCPKCGYGLHARPCGRRSASLKRKHFQVNG